MCLVNSRSSNVKISGWTNPSTLAPSPAPTHLRLFCRLPLLTTGLPGLCRPGQPPPDWFRPAPPPTRAAAQPQALAPPPHTCCHSGPASRRAHVLPLSPRPRPRPPAPPPHMCCHSLGAPARALVLSLSPRCVRAGGCRPDTRPPLRRPMDAALLVALGLLAQVRRLAARSPLPPALRLTVRRSRGPLALAASGGPMS